jgi:hypothetical protein
MAVDYHNYILDGAVAQPMFGLGVEQTVLLINELLDHDPACVSIRSCGTHTPADYAVSSRTPIHMDLGFPLYLG